MKSMHMLMMGACAVIVVLALVSGSSIGPALFVFIGCFLMMVMMMRMMGGGGKGGSKHD